LIYIFRKGDEFTFVKLTAILLNPGEDTLNVPDNVVNEKLV